MVLLRPRLTDFYDLPISQEEADFAIPFLDEDIPLCIDPFLLWKCPSLQDNSLHTAVVNSFNHLGRLHQRGKSEEAISTLVQASECDEVGLGFSTSRQGRRIGVEAAKKIIALFNDIPQIAQTGFTHFEEIQLLVDNFSKDRISDITANFLTSFLIDFSMEQCEKHSIPTQDTTVSNVFDYRQMKFVGEERVKLPVNPTNGKAILLGSVGKL